MAANEIFPRNITTTNSKHGKYRARKHAQSEANRLGVKVVLQLDPFGGKFGDERLKAIVSLSPVYLNMPWRTFYPDASPQRDGANETGQA